MSFGFSVGDILAVSSLAKDIYVCLRDIGGAKSEYQDLERELDCLQKALAHLDTLQSKNPSPALDSIRYAALSCRSPLEAFLRKIRKYEASLGPRSTKTSLQTQMNKIRFRFGPGDEVGKLQNYLNVHIGTINILLIEHGLESMGLANEKSESERLQISRRLEETQQILHRVQDSVSTQKLAIVHAISTLEKVYAMISGELGSSWTSLRDMVAKACVSTQQIYTVVLDIRSSLTYRPDARWSFFQDPIVCEDALGRKFPVPSEYDFSLLDAIIHQRFLIGPGSAEVSLGDYEFIDASDRSRTISETTYMRPGSAILMTILIGKPPPDIMTDVACPMPRCRSTFTKEVDGGGRLCCSCNVWFTVASKKRKSMIDLWNASKADQIQEDPTNESERQTTQDGARKRQKTAANNDSEDSIINYKNVSLADNTIEKSRFPILNGESGSPILNDALVYLDTLKERVPEKYDDFLNIMRDFKASKIDSWGVGFAVLRLCGEYEDLITGMSTFMPDGWSLDRSKMGVTNGSIWRMVVEDVDSNDGEDSASEEDKNIEI